MMLTQQGALPSLPDDARGITVEGMVDENRVEAVGRTARLRLVGRLPVYFAPPESLCAVPSPLVLGPGGAASVGEVGDVLLVGARTEDGALSSRIVHAHDLYGEPRELSVALPVPSVGQTIDAVGERRFVVVGGAGPVGPLSSLVGIDLDASSVVSDPWLIRWNETTHAVAHHRSVRLSDGSIWVTGGCIETEPESGACRVTSTSVTATTFWVDPDSEPLEARPGPSLAVARYDHAMVVGRDDVVTVIGGVDGDGHAVGQVERCAPDLSAWEMVVDLSPWMGDAAIVGGTVLEGGLVVALLDDGSALLAGDADVQHVTPNPSWTARPGLARQALALSGERVLVDTLVLPFGLLGADYGAQPSTATEAWHVVDLLRITPGVPKMAATLAQLDDGSVLLAGGVNPDDGGPASGPAFLRYRSALDGPDEGTPNISALALGSFVAHHGDIDVEETGDGRALRLAVVEDHDERLPPVRAHARGFRSRAFELHVTFAAHGGAVPYLVFESGTRAALSLRLTEGARAWRRTASAIVDVDCEGDPPVLGDALRVHVEPESVTVRGDDTEWVCGGAGDVDVAVGVGAAGVGVVWARDFRLTRQ